MSKKSTSIMITDIELDMLKELNRKTRVTTSAIVTFALSFAIKDPLLFDKVEQLERIGSANFNIAFSIDQELFDEVSEKIELAKDIEAISKQGKYRSAYSLSRVIIVALKNLKDRCEL